jgi:hypothetical protein
MVKKKRQSNLRADERSVIGVEGFRFFGSSASWSSFLEGRAAKLGGARAFCVTPFPFLRGNGGRNGLHGLRSLGFNFFFRGSRGFVRNRDFALRLRRNLGVLGNDRALFDISTFGKGRKRRRSLVVLDKIGMCRQEIVSISSSRRNSSQKVKNEQANDKDRLPGEARWWHYMVSRGKMTGRGLSC